MVLIFRYSRAGRLLANEVANLKLGEILALGVTSLLLVLAVLGLGAIWVLWQVENAQIIAGLREPRDRPMIERERPRLPEVPPIPIFPNPPPTNTFPEFPPTITFPDFDTMP